MRRVAAGAVAVAGILLPFKRLTTPGTTRPVVVASTDIPAGVVIDRAGLVVARWPHGTQPAGAFQSIDSVANRVSRIPIRKGEAIVPGRLAPPGTVNDLEVQASPGKRAYAIRLNDAAGLAGMVWPNSRVDIIVVTNDANQQKQVAKMFMENMRVLAISTRPDAAQDGRPIDAAVVSVEVMPDEAERLAIASTVGIFQLVLRGSGDVSPSGTRGASSGDIKRLLRDNHRETLSPIPTPPARLHSERAILLLTQPPIYVDLGRRHPN